MILYKIFLSSCNNCMNTQSINFNYHLLCIFMDKNVLVKMEPCMVNKSKAIILVLSIRHKYIFSKNILINVYYSIYMSKAMENILWSDKITYWSISV